MDMTMFRRRGLLLNTPHIVNESGSIVTFDSAYDKVPIKSLICNIEPIQSGSGDPSPDNVRPISGRTGLNVVRTGKNLLALPFLFYTSAPTSKENCFYLPEGSYIFSFSDTSVPTWRFILRLYNDDGTEVTSGITASGLAYRASVHGYTNGLDTIIKQFTFILDKGYYVRILFWSAPSGTVFTNTQLEIGSTATDYEPYKGETYTVNWETEAGTVYGGTLDVVSGKLIITHKSFVFDGTNASFQKYDVTSGTLYRTAVLSDRKFGQLPGLLISDKFKTVLLANRSNLTVSAGALNNANIDFIFNDASTVAEWNDWLTQNNVMVCYMLDTPTEIKLTSQEVKALLGENNIWCDSGYASVDYWKWGN